MLSIWGYLPTGIESVSHLDFSWMRILCCNSMKCFPTWQSIGRLHSDFIHQCFDMLGGIHPQVDLIDLWLIGLSQSTHLFLLSHLPLDFCTDFERWTHCGIFLEDSEAFVLFESLFAPEPLSLGKNYHRRSLHFAFLESVRSHGANFPAHSSQSSF